MSRRLSVSVTLNEAARERLRELSEVEGRSVSQVVERLILGAASEPVAEKIVAPLPSENPLLEAGQVSAVSQPWPKKPPIDTPAEAADYVEKVGRSVKTDSDMGEFRPDRHGVRRQKIPKPGWKS